MDNIVAKAIQLLNEKYEMMADYTPITEEIPDNGSTIFRPKKEFVENGKLKKNRLGMIRTLNEINSLPKDEREVIKRKIAQHERNLKYKK